VDAAFIFRLQNSSFSAWALAAFEFRKYIIDSISANFPLSSLGPASKKTGGTPRFARRREENANRTKRFPY